MIINVDVKTARKNRAVSISRVGVHQHRIRRAISDFSQGKWEKTSQKILAVPHENGKLVVLAGHHKFVRALLDGSETVDICIDLNYDYSVSRGTVWSPDENKRLKGLPSIVPSELLNHIMRNRSALNKLEPSHGTPIPG